MCVCVCVCVCVCMVQSALLNYFKLTREQLKKFTINDVMLQYIYVGEKRKEEKIRMIRYLGEGKSLRNGQKREREREREREA